MVEYIKNQNEVLAIVLRKDFSKEGASFFTDPGDPFQFGTLQYKKGWDIPAHKHLKAKREIDLFCEVLFIQSGKIEVTFYDDNNSKIETVVLVTGDAILMKRFGHGIKLLEDSKLIEIKQGPYLGKEKDKEYLDL